MIVSVSRRTDIPAYYSDWFFHRLEEGYVLTKNPMNPKQQKRVELNSNDVDCFVFWSKNPAPLLKHINKLSEYGYYIQFTLNDYPNEIEPNLPVLTGRTDTFKRLAEIIGPHRMVWRYDPILITPSYSADKHIETFGSIAHDLSGYTHKCVFSYFDYYTCNKKAADSRHIKELSADEKLYIANQIAPLAQNAEIELSTCCEDISLEQYGIAHASCIDPKIIAQCAKHPVRITSDKNQRKNCGCAASIDIGAYDTCPAGCIYCYATHSKLAVMKNISTHDPESHTLI